MDFHPPEVLTRPAPSVVGSAAALFRPPPEEGCWTPRWCFLYKDLLKSFEAVLLYHPKKFYKGAPTIVINGVINPSCVCRYKDKSSIHYPQHATSRYLALQSRIQPLLLKRLGLSKYQRVKWHSKGSETFQADDFHIPTCILLLCAEIIAAI